MVMMMMNKSVGTQVGRRRRRRRRRAESLDYVPSYSQGKGEGGSIRQHSTIKPTNKGTAAGAALRFVRLSPQHVTSGIRERNDILYARKRGKRVLIRETACNRERGSKVPRSGSVSLPHNNHITVILLYKTGSWRRTASHF